MIIMSFIKDTMQIAVAALLVYGAATNINCDSYSNSSVKPQAKTETAKSEYEAHYKNRDYRLDKIADGVYSITETENGSFIRDCSFRITGRPLISAPNGKVVIESERDSYVFDSKLSRLASKLNDYLYVGPELKALPEFQGMPEQIILEALKVHLSNPTIENGRLVPQDPVKAPDGRYTKLWTQENREGLKIDPKTGDYYYQDDRANLRSDIYRKENEQRHAEEKRKQELERRDRQRLQETFNQGTQNMKRDAGNFVNKLFGKH